MCIGGTARPATRGQSVCMLLQLRMRRCELCSCVSGPLSAWLRCRNLDEAPADTVPPQQGKSAALARPRRRRRPRAQEPEVESPW